MTAEDRGLDRFVAAQEPVYRQALAELAAGAKQGHWMWFVFPQIAGLGRSAMAQTYAIRDADEARAYLAHPLLGPRLRACTDAMMRHAGRRSAEAVLGAIDAVKLRSCCTLFEAAGLGAAGGDADAPFSACLDAFYAGERDAATLARLG